MWLTDSEIVVPTLGLLAGCVLNTYVGAFLFAYTGVAGRYRRYQFQRDIPGASLLLGENAIGVMNRRTVLFPIVEIGTAVCLLYWTQQFGVLSNTMARYAVGALIMLLACLVNIQTGELPDHFTGMLAVAGVVFMIVDSFHEGVSVIGARLAGGTAGFCLVYFTRRAGTAVLGREAMGLGDVFLSIGVGTFLGWPNVLVWFFGSPVFGFAIGIIHVFRTGSQEIRTGPMWLMGFLLCTYAPAGEFIGEVRGKTGDPIVLSALGVYMVAMIAILWVVRWLQKVSSEW